MHSRTARRQLPNDFQIFDQLVHPPQHSRKCRSPSPPHGSGMSTFLNRCERKLTAALKCRPKAPFLHVFERPPGINQATQRKCALKYASSDKSEKHKGPTPT